MMTEPRAIATSVDDLGPVALDLIAKWAIHRNNLDNAASAAESLRHCSRLITVENSMRGLANEIEARRLAEL